MRLEAGDVDGRPYVALELVPGEDLRRLVTPPMTKPDATPAQVVIPRARALQLAHRRVRRRGTPTRERLGPRRRVPQ